jgi:hypothetical protein
MFEEKKVACILLQHQNILDAYTFLKFRRNTDAQ